MMSIEIEPSQRRRICAVALCDKRSVKRAYTGKPTRPTTYERIRRAAKQLGLPTPPARGEN